jgi:O-acetylhomoserine/O-acetylserine sulfhydrylase-like pyridoxal-dependent enzyme
VLTYSGYFDQCAAVGGAICTGGNFDLSVTASGSPDIHYQWQSFNGTTWSNVGTDISTIQHRSTLRKTTTYRVFVNADESGCEDVYSAEVIVTVSPDIVISAQPVGGSICTGGNFDLSVTASGSPAIQYQWEQFNGTAWVHINGATASTYNTGTLTGTTQYRVFVFANKVDARCILDSGDCNRNTGYCDNTQPVGGSICTGGNFDLSVTASGSPSPHYQWEAFNGTTWSVVGSDVPTYNTGTLTTTTSYRVFVYNTAVVVRIFIQQRSPSLYSRISRSVHSLLEDRICTGGNFNLSVTASGSPDIHYQWEQQTGPTTWITVGSDSPNYNTGALTATTNYRVWV